MGKRRVRCLKALGYTDISMYDINYPENTSIDGVFFVSQNWKPETVFEVGKYDAVIVSTPPLTKQIYINLANKYNVPVFCEADVTLYNGNYHSSSTMRFHPAVQKIKELIDNGTLGKIYTFTHHCGNHIEDWHPGCDKKTYYAMKKETGGCKEIFPFELSWLSYLLGTPIDCSGFVDKKLNLPDVLADDVYAASVKFATGNPEVRKITFSKNAISQVDIDKIKEALEKGESCIPIPCDISDMSFSVVQAFITGTVLIDIVSRPAIRELRIVGEMGTLKWNWNDSFVSIETADGVKVTHGYDRGQAAPGYNENIPEFMYQHELANWIAVIQGKEQYLYSREDETAVMEMLRKAEGK